MSSLKDRYKTILDIKDWQGKRALVRVDFNVPFNEQHEITDDSRIRESLPTLQYLLDHGAKVIVVSHLGRPKGKVSDEFRLAPVVKHLQSLLGNTTVKYCPEIVTEKARQAVDSLQAGEILVLENIRFEAGEEKNDPELAKQLAAYADIYVNDAFGTAHRAHASTEGVAHWVSTKVAGLLMNREIDALGSILENPKRPFTAIIGGSKVSTKITVLENLLDKVDHLVIGGGMLFTFLKAKGFEVGNSLVEEDYLEMARALLQKDQQNKGAILLAEDVVIADAFKADANAKVVPVEQIPAGWMGLDIGPKSIEAVRQTILKSKTALWNGPLGVFEFPRFAEGTHQVAQTLADWTRDQGGQSVLGGGDTVAALEQFHYDFNRFTHVSSGGGASLEFLEGKTLPGIAVLDRVPQASPAQVS